MNVKESIEAEIAAIRAKAESDVATLQAKFNELPTEVHQLSEEVWAKVKAFFN